MSIILGIDPGSRITGFGVVRMNGKKLEYVASGCIRVKDGILSDKLNQIFDCIAEVVQEYKPDEAAIEQVFMAKNADSALKLGQARGAAMVAMAQHALVVAEYSARQIKQSVVGTGGADKSQVQHMVSSLLGLSSSPQADAADGLAVAICHAHAMQNALFKAGAKKVTRGRLR
ncbi:crossover junction endodeoxyribonuclease RuvC [Aliikangiella sp. IMCC44359]|uniref:crossover junction endodeoxyribonuclease RuvC n=1 Tax=Aliikangiella sp. IMCC44359 TaxID=3459125 RepID=UPI00403B083A